MEPTPRFSESLDQLHDSRRERIQTALERSDVSDLQDLKGIVRGMNRTDATDFLENELSISKFDASALAGVLLASSARADLAPAFQLDFDGHLQNTVEACVFPANQEGSCLVDRLVDIDRTITEADAIISKHIETVGTETGGERVNPLIISALARGGKTTILKLLFAARKEAGHHAIFLNGNGPFKRGVGESHLKTILRLIGCQLIDKSLIPVVEVNAEDMLLRYATFSTANLVRCLDESCGDTPTVLFIDELNRISDGRPLDADASSFLKEHFLDKKNRYLVFSTHVSLAVCRAASALLSSSERQKEGKVQLGAFLDSRKDPSQRTCLTVPYMPCATDMTLINRMGNSATDTSCSGITPAHVALYGGIPALIFASAHSFHPVERFSAANIEIKREEQDLVLMGFLTAVLSGDNINNILYEFRQFSTVVGSKVRWPPVYVATILGLFDSIKTLHITKMILETILVHSSCSEAGKEWEVIVELAITLQCLDAKLNSGAGPFGMILPGSCPNVVRISLPANVKTLDDAHVKILELISVGIIGKNTVAIVTPVYAKFPLYDTFVVSNPKCASGGGGEKRRRNASHSKGIIINGVQAKKGGRGASKADVPDWVCNGYLVRGAAADAQFNKEKWTYMTEEEIKDLLGYSLSVLYPREWLLSRRIA